MDGVMAVVTCFAANFAPKNWALCNGQIMPISTNQALFSLLGTTFGGNGVTTFALPDLRGRRPVGTGTAPGLSTYALGQTAGAEGILLNANHLPPHTHNGTVNLALDVENAEGTVARAISTYPAIAPHNAYATAANGKMKDPAYQATIGMNPAPVPVNTRMPYTVVNYIICLYGVYPSRN